MILDAVSAAVTNVVVIAGLPFLGYFAYHKWRHKRGFIEVARRAGFRIGKPRYLGYGLIASTISVGARLLGCGRTQLE